jgi:hypothetical protein
MLTRASLPKRLSRLDLALASTGCVACAGWSEIALGEDDGRPTRPVTCPDCGRAVPIRTLVCIIGVPVKTP